MKTSKTLIYKVSLRAFSLFLFYCGTVAILEKRAGHGLFIIGFGIYVALCATEGVVALWAVRNEKLTTSHKKASPVWFSLLGTIGMVLAITGIALQIF
jgi:hypothetical protein